MIAAATTNGMLLIAYIPPDHTGSIMVDMIALKDKIYKRIGLTRQAEYQWPLQVFPVTIRTLIHSLPPEKIAAGRIIGR